MPVKCVREVCACRGGTGCACLGAVVEEVEVCRGVGPPASNGKKGRELGFVVCLE